MEALRISWSVKERPLESALDLGALAAAFKVTSPHTIPPGFSAENLVAFARKLGVAFAASVERLLPAGMAQEGSRGL